MFTANELLQTLNQYIDSIVFDRKPASLYEPIKYSLSMGGKENSPNVDVAYLSVRIRTIHKAYCQWHQLWKLIITIHCFMTI